MTLKGYVQSQGHIQKRINTTRNKASKLKSIGHTWIDLKTAWSKYKEGKKENSEKDCLNAMIEIRRLQKELEQEQSEFPELNQAILDGKVSLCEYEKCHEPILLIHTFGPVSRFCSTNCRVKSYYNNSVFMLATPNRLMSYIHLKPIKKRNQSYREIRVYVKKGELEVIKITPEQKDLWEFCERIQAKLQNMKNKNTLNVK